MTLAPPGVLRPGDRVRFDGADHLVVALTGTLIRLRSDGGTEAVVLAAYLMASPEFAVVGSDPLPAVGDREKPWEVRQRIDARRDVTAAPPGQAKHY